MQDAAARGASLGDLLKSLPQYLLPHHLLSRCMHRLTRVQTVRFKDTVIRWFIRRFGVDMSLAAQPDPGAYPSFNAFFTRALRDGVRPVDPDIERIVCPVDGTVSQCGAITDGRIFQAKGRSFSALELLGGEQALAERFDGGDFATIYLSPRDYHRIHAPLAGTLMQMLHVPGRLFSVNPPTTRAVPGLFARNERVASLFDTGAGLMAVVKVGALFVSSIETVWAGEVTPPRGHAIRRWYYPLQGEPPRVFAKGAEIARFNMGSTVILLFEPGRMSWDAGFRADASVCMGQPIGRILRA